MRDTHRRPCLDAWTDEVVLQPEPSTAFVIACWAVLLIAFPAACLVFVAGLATKQRA